LWGYDSCPVTVSGSSRVWISSFLIVCCAQTLISFVVIIFLVPFFRMGVAFSDADDSMFSIFVTNVAFFGDFAHIFG